MSLGDGVQALAGALWAGLHELVARVRLR